jgi:hypothetical protein
MAGALAAAAPPGVGWRLTEAMRGLAAVYGVEVHGGEWPDGAPPTLRLERRGIVAHGGEAPPAPDRLVDRLRELQVESWEALHRPDARAFRFRPLGATHVLSIFPPMRYTRGLDEDEARLVAEVCTLSTEAVGARAAPVDAS